MIFRFLFVRALTRTPPEGRLWFWFTDAARDGKPMLAVSAIDSDPDLVNLNEMVAEAAAPPTARTRKGLADIGPTGAVRFFVDDGGAAFLQQLAALAAAQHAEVADLRRLAGAQVLEETADGIVVHQDDALWGPLLSETTPPSAAVQRFGVAEALSTMGEDSSELLFWLATEGPGDLPALTLLTDPRDKGGERLQRRIRALRQAGAGGQTARGVVRVEVSGSGKRRLVFASPDDCPPLLAALGRWTQAHLSDEPRLKRLRGAAHATLDAAGAVQETHSDNQMWREVFRA